MPTFFCLFIHPKQTSSSDIWHVLGRSRYICVHFWSQKHPSWAPPSLWCVERLNGNPFSSGGRLSCSLATDEFGGAQQVKAAPPGRMGSVDVGGHTSTACRDDLACAWRKLASQESHESREESNRRFEPPKLSIPSDTSRQRTAHPCTALLVPRTLGHHTSSHRRSRWGTGASLGVLSRGAPAMGGSG